MISRERIEQLRRARVRWQDVDDLIAALDEREELLHRIINPNNNDFIRSSIMGEIRELLCGGRYEVK